MKNTPANNHFSQEAIDEVILIGKRILREEHLILRVQIQSPEESSKQETYETIDEYLVHEMSDKKVVVMFEIDSKKVFFEKDQEKPVKEYHMFFDIKEFKAGSYCKSVLIDKIESYGKRGQLSKFPKIDGLIPSLYYHKHKHKKSLDDRFWLFLFGRFFKKKDQTLVLITLSDATIYGASFEQTKFQYALL